MYSKLGEGMS